MGAAASIAQARSALLALDDRVCGHLADGTIRVLSTKHLLAQAADFLLKRRQELPESFFLSPEAAVALVRRGERALGALTYGWLSMGNPDPAGARLAEVRGFLRAHPHVEGLFWDFASLPQKPRSKEEDAMFKRGLEVMADLYASPAGTVVLRAQGIPPNSAGVAGYNDRPYPKRGWCIFESSVGLEAVARLGYEKELREGLEKLPLAKMYDIGKGADRRRHEGRGRDGGGRAQAALRRHRQEDRGGRLHLRRGGKGAGGEPLP